MSYVSNYFTTTCLVSTDSSISRIVLPYANDHLARQPQEVISIAFSNDSRTLFVALKTGNCFVGDITNDPTDPLRKRFTTHIPLWARETRAAFSKDNQTVSILSMKSYRVIDANTGHIMFEKSPPSQLPGLGTKVAVLGQPSWHVALRPVLPKALHI